MIHIKDFEDKEGLIDWKAYRKAQEEAGDICFKCGNHIFSRTKIGYTQCGECKELGQKEEVCHTRFIRCPKCEYLFTPGEQYKWYEEGQHEVFCWKCEHQFEITTYVTYEFQSPKLLRRINER